MSKNSKKKIYMNRKFINPTLVLGNNLISQNLSDEHFFDMVNRFFSVINNQAQITLFQKYIKNQRVKSGLNCYAIRVEDFFSKLHYRTVRSQSSTIKILSILLHEESEKINEFVKIQKSFEQNALLGNYSTARELLDKCFSKFGESFWYIRNSLLLYALQGEPDKGQDFAEECIARSQVVFLTEEIKRINALIMSFDDSLLPMKNNILRSHSEYRVAGYNTAVSRLGLLYIPEPLIVRSGHENSSDIFDQFPLVDQYTLMLKRSQYILCDNRYLEHPLREIVHSFLVEISQFINDDSVNSIINSRGSNEVSEPQRLLYEAYEAGNYQQVINYYENELVSFKNSFSIINIVAKSYAYLELYPTKIRCSIDELVELFYKIYTSFGLDSLNEDAISSKIIKFYGFSNWADLQSELYISQPHKYDSDDANLAFKLALSGPGDKNPILFDIMKSNEDVYTESSLLRFGGGSLKSSDQIPDYRILKSQIIHDIKNKKDISKIQGLFDLYKSKTPLLKDYLELYSEFCLRYNLINELISFSTSHLLQNANLLFCFPIKELVSIIESKQIISLEALTIVYYYNKYISSTKDYLLNELFDDYLFELNIDRPSELLVTKKELSNIEVQFFRDICSLELLDFLSCFKGSPELRHERVKIIDLLTKHNAIDNLSRMQEVENIISQQIIESATSELNGAKISVDENVLIKNNIETVSSIIDRYKQASDEIEELQLEIPAFNDIESNIEKFERISGSKISLIVTLVALLKESFINDEKYGLDKNLSTEIRHGFFSNLIRATISNNHLLAEMNDKGDYVENRYWKDINSFISDSVWKDVDQHLKDFSKSINMLLMEVEEWMQIKSSLDKQSRIFSYGIDVEFIHAVQHLVDQGKNAFDISSYVMNFFWEVTEQHLVTIQERLNGEFKSRIDIIFEELSTEINRSKKTAAMYELMQAITITKSQIQEDIALTSGWFKRAYSLSKVDRELDRLVEIALHAFKEVNSDAIEILSSVSVDFRSIKVRSNSVKPFILSIINVLDNCFRRSGLGVETKVRLSGFLAENKAVIQIFNNLSEDRNAILTEKYISEIQSKISENKSLVLMRTEGGSGLVKANNHMKFVSEKSEVRVKRNQDEFIVEIIYVI